MAFLVVRVGRMPRRCAATSMQPKCPFQDDKDRKQRKLYFAYAFLVPQMEKKTQLEYFSIGRTDGLVLLEVLTKTDAAIECGGELSEFSEVRGTPQSHPCQWNVFRTLKGLHWIRHSKKKISCQPVAAKSSDYKLVLPGARKIISSAQKWIGSDREELTKESFCCLVEELTRRTDLLLVKMLSEGPSVRR